MQARTRSGSVGGADVVLRGGRVVTVDARFSVVEGLAVKDGRIVAVGNDASVMECAGSGARVVELDGRCVLPGFVDTHAHLDREGLRRALPSLQGCRSIADVQAVVRRLVSQRPERDWLVLLPYGEPPFHLDVESVLAEGRFPTRAELDAAAPDHPVWLRAVYGPWSHSPPFVHVLNSAALAACGITPDTPDPVETVTIEHDERGELTGRILEHHVFVPLAEHTVLRAAPRFDFSIRREALQTAMQLSLAAGTTSVFEGHGIAAEVFRVYRDLHDHGEQVVRAHLPISPPPSWSSPSVAEREVLDWAHYACGMGFGDSWLKVAGLYLDYGPHQEPRLAELSRRSWPYTGWAGFGEQGNSPETYRALCHLAARYRLRVSTITDNEKTLDEVLGIWSEVDAEHSITDLRWVLVHVNSLDLDRDVPRIRRLGCVVSAVTASTIYRAGLARAREAQDEERLFAYRDYTDNGLNWSLPSDNKPYWMQFHLWAAVTRRERVENRVIGPAQRLTVSQALRALTYAGAYVAFEEHDKGSLEPGKLADLQVLSDDPLQIPPDQLKNIDVLLTMVNGDILHDTGELTHN